MLVVLGLREGVSKKGSAVADDRAAAQDLVPAMQMAKGDILKPRPFEDAGRNHLHTPDREIAFALRGREPGIRPFVGTPDIRDEGVANGDGPRRGTGP